MKFYFCETCGKRVTEQDVEAGQARNKKLKGVYCSNCAEGVMTMETLPVSEEQARKILGKPSSDAPPPSNALPGKPRRESSIIQLAGVRKPGDSNAPLRIKQSAGSPLKSPQKSSALVGVIAGLLVALVLGAMLLFSGGEKPKSQAGGKTTAAAENMPIPTRTEPRKTIAFPAGPGKRNSEDKTAGVVETKTQNEPAPVTATINETIEKPTPAENTPLNPPVASETKSLSSEPTAGKKKSDEPMAVKVDEAENQKRFAAVLKELAPLLRQNQFGEAEKLLDEKLRDPALAEIAGQLKKEKADVVEIRAIRLSAMDALRAKNGVPISLTLRGVKTYGTVKVEPNSPDVVFVLRRGGELTITSGQLDPDDICTLLPLSDGGDKVDHMRQRGVMFLAAGDPALAERYFVKARERGMGSAGAPYLERIAALKSDEKEGAAFEAWKKADGLFTSRNWQAAKQAYESFQRDFAGTAALADNTEVLTTRIDAIDDALGPPKELSLDFGGGVKMELMRIPAGEFEMGSSDGEKNEKPVHKVKIPRPFYMGKYTVTQSQYEKVMGKNPSGFKGEDHPVESVNLADVEEFCKRAGKLSGKPIRLPTEAEWEYACRAGTKTKYNTGDNDAALGQAAWYSGNSGGSTHPVGQKKTNAWGLYDMHGNVWQICQDWFGDDYYAKSPAEDPQGPAKGTYHVMRGGSFFHPGSCRSACRSGIALTDRFNSVGFRVVMPPASKAP